MQKTVCCLICAFFIGGAQVSYAHEINASELLFKRHEQRKKYEICVKKAPEKGEKRAQVVKKCREQYVKKRLFTPEELLHLYKEHPMEAEDIYTDMMVGIKAEISQVAESDMGYPEIRFHLDSFGMTGVRCEFAKDSAKEVAKLKAGDKVRLLGISKGLVRDNHVYVTNCEIIQ